MMGQGFGDAIARQAVRAILVMWGIAALLGAGVCLLLLWLAGRI